MQVVDQQVKKFIQIDEINKKGFHDISSFIEYLVLMKMQQQRDDIVMGTKTDIFNYVMDSEQRSKEETKNYVKRQIDDMDKKQDGKRAIEIQQIKTNIN